MIRRSALALLTAALLTASLTATATTALASPVTRETAGHRADLGGGPGPNPGPGGHCRGQIGAGPGGYCGSEADVPEPNHHQHYGE